MTTQVERLEALLARVQHNRQLPRAASPDALASKQVAGSPAAVHAAPTVVQPQAVVQPSAERAAPAQRSPEARPPEARPQPRPAPAPVRAPATPLEMAVEGRLGSPAAQGAASMQQQPASYEGRVVADPQPVQPGRPIAHAVSMHPPSQALTFGELLRRSLSLRPR